MTKRPSKIRYELTDFSDGYESEEPSTVTSRRSSAKPRAKTAIEYFPVVDDDTEFAKRHHYWCVFSGDFDAIEDDSRSYTMCQGCSHMYHVECLGTKVDRQRMGHNIIVLDERDGKKTCVLQCGRCSGGGKVGMNTMRCLACGKIGDRCGEFKYPDKLEATELDESEREAKLLHGWNDVSKIMFRCMNCARACHFNHLPVPSGFEQETNTSSAKSSPVQGDAMQIDSEARVPEVTDTTNEAATITRSVEGPNIFEIYTSDGYWACNECREYRDEKADVILGWRPTKTTITLPKDAPVDFNREYLVKFEGHSYASATWVPATWLAGISYMMKKHFDAKELNAIESAEEVIIEAWLHPDIIFDVRYAGDTPRDKMKFRSEAEELEAISQVTSALCKWQKLTYEECMFPWFLD